MKKFIKSTIKKLVKTTEGKIVLSLLLLICVLATKGLYDNNMQIVQGVTQKHLIKSNILYS